MKFIPDPRTVAKVIAPGLWFDHEGQIHLCAESFCEGQGVPATPENQAAAEQACKDLVREKCPSATIIDLFDR